MAKENILKRMGRYLKEFGKMAKSKRNFIKINLTNRIKIINNLENEYRQKCYNRTK